MNLIEHYIKEIHSAKDVTSMYEVAIGKPSPENIFSVDVTINAYGKTERIKRHFFEKELKDAIKDGYYLG